MVSCLKLYEWTLTVIGTRAFRGSTYLTKWLLWFDASSKAQNIPTHRFSIWEYSVSHSKTIVWKCLFIILSVHLTLWIAVIFLNVRKPRLFNALSVIWGDNSILSKIVIQLHTKVFNPSNLLVVYVFDRVCWHYQTVTVLLCRDKVYEWDMIESI